MSKKKLSEIESLKKEKKRCEKKGKLDEVAQHCNAIGDEYAQLGLYDEAIEQHEEELGLSEALGDRLGVAIANRKLGECRAEKGNFNSAFKYINRYLEISQCEENLVEEQRAFATLGRTYYMQVESVRGEVLLKKCLKDAETAYKNSLEVCERLKTSTKEDVYMEMRARLLLNLGLVYEQKNDIDLCAQHLKEAIKITEKYQLPADRYRCYITLASIYQRNSSYQKALHFYDLALKSAQQTKNKSQQVEVFTQKALIHLQQDNVVSCRKCLQKAYKVRTGNEEEKLKVVADLKAAVRLERCSEQLCSDHSGSNQMKLHEKCGDASAHLGAFEKALAHYKNMLSCGERLSMSEVCLIPAYMSLAQTYQDLKKYKSAIEYYTKEVQCRGEDYSQIAKSYLNMADCYDKLGAGFEKMKDVYQNAFKFASLARSTKLQRQVLLDQAEMEKSFNEEQSLRETQQKLGEFGFDTSEDDDEESQETVASEDESDVDLRDLSSSEDEIGEEEYDRSTSVAGVVRRPSYKIKKNEKGETELHIASIQGNFKRVKSLIERGHPVNERDCAGWLPIHEASNHGWSQIVEYLLSKGARVNDRGGVHCDGTTPLLDVCGVACAKVDCKKANEAATYIRRHLDIVHMLVKAGANVHAKDMDGHTALDLLVLQRGINCDELSREELIEVRKTEKFLKAVMEGNNPHLTEDSMAQVGYSDIEEEDSLPTLSSRRNRRSRVQNAVVEEDSQDPDLSNEDDTSSEHIFSATGVADVGVELSVLKEHPERAPLAYRAAMKDIRRSAAAHSPTVPKRRSQGKVNTRALLTSEEYAGDNWLEDDMGINKMGVGKRKRKDPQGVFSTMGSRKPHQDSDKSSSEDEGIKGKKRVRRKETEQPCENESDPEWESETTLCATDRDDVSGDNNTTVTSATSLGLNNSRTDTDSDFGTLTSRRATRIDISNGSLGESKRNDTDTRFKSQDFNDSSGLRIDGDLDAHFNMIDSTSDSDIEALTVPRHKSKTALSLPQSQARNSFLQRKKPQQLKITNFGTRVGHTQARMMNHSVGSTQSNNTQYMNSGGVAPSVPRGPMMRLRVKVKDKQILVPVPQMEEPPTVGWLAKETSNRYYQLCNLRPVLSVTTKDGAIFSPDDLLLDLVTNNDELHSIIERWDLPPISHRYADACKSLKTVIYTNIKTLLHKSSASNTLDLQKLSLKCHQFLPVARTLQCYSTLKQLFLSGNKISDDGVRELAKVLPTLSSLSHLDLSCNQITCNGIKALADTVESTENTEKPLQALESLSVSYNSLGDSCTLSIARLVSNLPALTCLNMAACDLTLHFFQQNRITLAQAIKEATVQEINMSHNALGSTGVELLLMSLRPESLCRLDLTATVHIAGSHNLTKHLERYLNQDGVVLQELNLSSCHLAPEAITDLCRCLEVNSTLRSLSVNSNKNLTLSELAAVLQASTTNPNSHLESLQCVGCGLVAPLSTDILDLLVDKLEHNAPLRSFEVSVEGLTKMDIDALVQEIWKGKWGDAGMYTTKGNFVKLWVKDEY